MSNHRKTKVLIHATADRPAIRITDAQYSILYFLLGDEIHADDDPHVPFPGFREVYEGLGLRHDGQDEYQERQSAAQIRYGLKTLVKNGLVVLMKEPGDRRRYGLSKLGEALMWLRRPEPDNTYYWLREGDGPWLEDKGRFAMKSVTIGGKAVDL